MKLNLKRDFGVTRESTLQGNGLRVTVFNKPKSPIYIRFSVSLGSRYDPIGKEGLAHFAEHMVTAGTKKFPNKKLLATEIESIGGIFNAFTNSEIVNINIEIATKKDANKAFTLLNEMLFKSLFSSETTEKERGSIFKELGERVSNPSLHLWDKWRELFYQGTPKARSLIGDFKSLNLIENNDLKKYWKNAVNHDSTLTVGGDIDLVTVSKLCSIYLNSIKAKRNKTNLDLPVIRDTGLIVKNYKSSESVHFMYGYRTKGFLDNDFIVLDVLAQSLGGGRASILMDKLRYKKGLVYGVWGVNYSEADSGSFIIKGSTSKKNFDETIKIISEELRKTISQFSQKELVLAKDILIKSKVRQLETAESWVDTHFFGETYASEKYLKLNEYLEKIEKVTADDIVKVAKKYFQENDYLAVCGDIKKNDIKFK